MGQHGYSTSVRPQYPNSVSKNDRALSLSRAYCLDVHEFDLLIWIAFFKHLFEMKMCVLIGFTLSCEESSNMFVA